MGLLPEPTGEAGDSRSSGGLGLGHYSLEVGLEAAGIAELGKGTRGGIG